MLLHAGLFDWEDWAPLLRAGTYAEAFLEDSSGCSLHVEDGELSEVAAGSERGIGLRYLHGPGPSGEPLVVHGCLNGLDLGAARALAGRLGAGLPPLAARRPRALRTRTALVRRPPSSVPLEEKVSLLLSVDRALRREFPHVAQVDLVYAEREKRCGVLNSEGDHALFDRIGASFSVSVTVRRDGVLQTGQESLGGLLGFEQFEDGSPLRAGRRAARCAVEKLSAPVARAGEMPVLLASSAGGTFVHEAIGHSLEADHVQEGTSPHYAGKLGRPVAPEFLTIVDDPTLPFARGSYPFDDEGRPAEATAAIRGGILCDYLYDRACAMKDGRASNGHGRRESFRHRPIPRMSNLYIAPGKHDPAAMLKGLDKGLLVTKMGGGQVNTATGEFVFAVDEGFWVEGGVVRHRVRDANMLGVGPEVLRSIDKLGWDAGWGIGTCGKDGQGVPVSDGQPTMSIPKLLIGGRDS